MTPEKIGRYTILDQIGTGGMGEVYSATDPELGRTVALKVLRSDLANQSDLVRRFEREARAIAALDHPNIIGIHTVEQVDEVRFLTMELVEGQTLVDHIEGQRIPLRRLLDWAIPMADAMSAAHERGITHRDFKPANVMISTDGRIKLLDFGLAKKVVEGSDDASTKAVDDTLTSAGSIVGTVSYMSPEQAEGRPIDPRSDIFSLGVVLYEMATGVRPFRGDTRISILSAIVNESPPPMTDLESTLPRQLDRIVRMALEKDRERRYQSAKDLRNELEQLRQEVTSGRAKIAAPVAPQRMRRRWNGALFGSLAGLVLGALSVFFLSGPPIEPLQVGVIERLSGGPELEVYPAISPNGEIIVYSAGRLGALRLYSRFTAGSEPVPLTEGLSGNHVWPVWSADRTQVAFRAEGRCWLVSPLGGELSILEGLEYPNGLAFSPSGDRIAFGKGGRLLTRRLSDGETVELVSMLYPTCPSWSPDGSKIAFSSGNPQFTFGNTQIGNLGEASIWIVPAEGGDPISIVDGRLNVNPVWRGEDELLFVSDREGSRDIYSIAIRGDGHPAAAPRRLTTGLNVHSFSLSDDGRRLACSRFTSRANLWSLPIPRDGKPVSSREAEPLTRGAQSIEGVGVSSDGRFIAYDSNLAGNQDIYLLDRSDGSSRRLTDHPRDDFLPMFSPDQEEIAFYSFRTGNRELFVMSSDGTQKRQVTDHSAQDRYPYWSPDQNRLVFYSDRSGRNELWVTSRDARGEPWGEPEQRTFEGGQYGRFSPDGDSLLYSNTSNLWILPTSGGSEPRSVLPDSFHLSAQPFPNWSADGKTIYFKHWDENGRGHIWSVPTAGGPVVELVNFEDSSPRTEFATDGQRFYFTITEQESDIYILELK